MSQSTERWLLAWLVTLVVAPYGFNALAGLVIAGIAVVDGQTTATVEGALAFVASLVSTAFFNMVYGSMILAAVPTLLVGVPASIVLERRRAMAFSSFAVVGAIGGSLVGPLVMAALSDFAFRPGAFVALLGAAYGCFTALTFRLFRGPGDAP